MTLEDLFPKPMVRALERSGIWTVEHLQECLPILDQVTSHSRYIGKARRELIEYVMLVELP